MLSELKIELATSFIGLYSSLEKFSGHASCSSMSFMRVSLSMGWSLPTFHLLQRRAGINHNSIQTSYQPQKEKKKPPVTTQVFWLSFFFFFITIQRCRNVRIVDTNELQH